MSKILMAEGITRVLCMVLFSVAAMLIGLNAETKTVFFIEKRAHVKDLQALWVLTLVASVAAGYNFLQLCRCVALAWLKKSPCRWSKFWSWICLLFDQAIAYTTVATSLAAAQGSLVALTGVKQFQWEKLCNIYARFCAQAAVGIVVDVLAVAIMVVVSSLSAYRLFRLYPSNNGSFARATGWNMFWNVDLF